MGFCWGRGGGSGSGWEHVLIQADIGSEFRNALLLFFPGMHYFNDVGRFVVGNWVVVEGFVKMMKKMMRRRR